MSSRGGMFWKLYCLFSAALSRRNSRVVPATAVVAPAPASKCLLVIFFAMIFAPYLLASGPPSGSLRYIAFGNLLTTGRSPHADSLRASSRTCLGILVVVDHAGTHLE